MGWQKRGLIYCPDGALDWAMHSFMTPCAIQRDPSTIRLYGGMRDANGVSRIGYVDVDGNNPSRVRRISPRPVLDIGTDGAFDDNGVILGDVLQDDDGRLRMYYVGFQLVKKVKFLAFSGLAVSSDEGETFQRYRQTPIMDRTDEGLYIRAIHSILRENGRWRIWYSSGNGWQTIDGTPYPRYAICYGESLDGIAMPDAGVACLNLLGNEYRIGRPRVYRTEDGYRMFCTADTLDKEYRVVAATSNDGIHWQRDEGLVPLAPSASGWDRDMVCYPVMHATPDGRRYLFYNGNGMGRTGVGYAELAGR